MHRINGNPADAEVLVEVLVGRDVAASALHPQLHVELAAVGDGRDVRFGLENLDILVDLDVLRAHDPRLVYTQIQRLGVVHVELQWDLLQVEDDIGRILDHSGNWRKLVEDAVDLDSSNGRAFYRGQQYTTQGVADRRAEPSLERLGIEPPESIGECFPFELETLGTLKTFPEHGTSFRLWAGSPGLQTC